MANNQYVYHRRGQHESEPSPQHEDMLLTRHAEMEGTVRSRSRISVVETLELRQKG